MRRRAQRAVPEYCDGAFTLYDIVEGKPDPSSPDYRPKVIRPRGIAPVWYREIAVYDRTRAVLEQTGREVTHKIRVPAWDGITTDCVVKIGDEQHKVYNAARIISAEGFPELELTLINPEARYKEVDG